MAPLTLTPDAEQLREPGRVGCVVAVGGLVGVGRDELTLFDPARGLAPVAIQATAGPVSALAASGDRLAVGSRGAVALLTVGAAGAVEQRATIATGGRVDGLALIGPVLWIADGKAVTGWRIDGASPVRLGRCAVELAGRVTAHRGALLVAAEHRGLQVVDVVDPMAPTTIGELRGPGDVTRVAVDGTTAYLADYTGGVHVVDLAAPARPTALAAWPGGVVGDVAVAGGRLWVAAGALVVVDVTTPARPRTIGSADPGHGDTAWAIAATADHVVTVGGGGVRSWRR